MEWPADRGIHVGRSFTSSNYRLQSAAVGPILRFGIEKRGRQFVDLGHVGSYTTRSLCNDGRGRAQAYVPAEAASPQASARLPGAHEQPGGSQCPSGAPTEGPKTARGVDDLGCAGGGAMRRAQRLRQRRDFAAVYRHGRPYRSDLLVLRVLRTDRSLSRFGFAVGRALG